MKKLPPLPITGGHVAEIELVYKSRIKAAERPVITSSADAVTLFRRHWNRETIELIEEFKVLYLNRGNKVIGIYPVSCGGIDGTVVDIRLIMAAAIRLAATQMVLAHNHPSGNLSPSRADQQTTEKIKMAAACLDIRVLDHVILTTDAFFSFADEGLL
jgi:DNA repair protein RadC